MKGKIYLAALGAGICMLTGIFFHGEVQAEASEENQIVTMDEEGNLLTEEAKTGLVEEKDGTPASAEIKAYSTEEYVVNFNTKGNAVTKYMECGTGLEGYTNGAYGADAAFLGMENGKVKFLLSGVTGLVDEKEVQVVEKSQAKSISYYYIKSGWLYHRITWNMNEAGYATTLKMGQAPGYLSENVTYYSYDGHYFYTDYRVMTGDYQNAARTASVNPASPYFNYFQYLPMRSASRYYADEFNAALNKKLELTGRNNSKLKGIGESIISNQDTYGVNALLMLGVAINESGWGTSRICLEKNNLFGLNAVDTTPYESANYFPSVEACVKEYAQIWMSKGYLNPADTARYKGGFLGNKGSGINVKYSSAPYMGETVAAIIWNLDQEMGGLDQNAYTIAVNNLPPQDNGQLNMRAESDRSSVILYQSTPRPCVSFILLSDAREGDFYKVQSDGLLNGDRSALAQDSDGRYNFNEMYAYSGADYMTIVNQGTAAGINHFRDVDPAGWYYGVVRNAYDNKIMTGMNVREFGVASPLARAHFATILYRLEGSPEVSYTEIYKDVPSDSFYASAAMWANNNQIITGYSDTGLFGGGNDILREQIAVILYRYAQYRGYDTSVKADIDTFPDAGSVSGYAKEAMQWAVAAGLIKGDNGCLVPQGTANRGECAAIIVRFSETYQI